MIVARDVYGARLGRTSTKFVARDAYGARPGRTIAFIGAYGGTPDRAISLVVLELTGGLGKVDGWTVPLRRRDAPVGRRGCARFFA